MIEILDKLWDMVKYCVTSTFGLWFLAFASIIACVNFVKRLAR